MRGRDKKGVRRMIVMIPSAWRITFCGCESDWPVSNNTHENTPDIIASSALPTHAALIRQVVHMSRRSLQMSGDEAPLEDKTAALSLRSKRTGRQQRKQTQRDIKHKARVQLFKLPTEILLSILIQLEPGDVLNVRLVSHRFRGSIDAHANVIGDFIIKQRYSLLVKCFTLPRLLETLDNEVQDLLGSHRRQAMIRPHQRHYQHVEPADSQLICTCLSCLMMWNNLCVVLDFAHWQDNLDCGEPIPVIPRGQMPTWNSDLNRRHASVVRSALRNSLWHARILQLHLQSTIRATRRHAVNKGNKRTHVDMTEDEATTGDDSFLSKHGPRSLEFPYQRDEYYLLEAYLPNRWWRAQQQNWIYTIAGQHDRDVEYLLRMSRV